MGAGSDGCPAGADVEVGGDSAQGRVGAGQQSRQCCLVGCIHHSGADDGSAKQFVDLLRAGLGQGEIQVGQYHGHSIAVAYHIVSGGHSLPSGSQNHIANCH